jgi:hypothetical protein
MVPGVNPALVISALLYIQAALEQVLALQLLKVLVQVVIGRPEPVVPALPAVTPDIGLSLPTIMVWVLAMFRWTKQNKKNPTKAKDLKFADFKNELRKSF